MDTNMTLEEDTQHGRYLTFALGKEFYGLEISYVKEIVGMQPITAIPEVTSSVKGIINLRGSIIAVIDMRLKFGKEETAYNDRTCIIVIDTLGISIGLIVDTVSEVLSIDDGNIVPPPDQRTGAQNHYIKFIGKVGSDIKLLLDCEKLFHGDELESLQSIV